MSRRTSTDEVTKGLAGYNYVSDLAEEIDGGDERARSRLHDLRLEQVKDDYYFRRKHVKYDHAESLMDRKSTDTDVEGIPSRNQIRPVVEDTLSVVTPNVPTAKLHAAEAYDPRVSDEELRLKEQYQREAEIRAQEAVKMVERRSQWFHARSRLMYDAVVLGVGFEKVGIEELPSRRRQPEMERLLSVPTDQWDGRMFEQFERLINEPTVERVDPKEVFCREGVTSMDDDDMTRISRVRNRDVRWLRDAYETNAIDAGVGILNLEQPSESQAGAANKTEAGYAETWELEEFVVEESIRYRMGPGDAKAQTTTIEYRDANLVYTAIAPGTLLDYRVFRPDEVPMELPFNAYYIKTSSSHPYGFSVPLMLELSQIFSDRMRAVMVEQGMNSISPQAFAIFLQALGVADRGEIENALVNGGPAYLEGNDIASIQDVIQAFPTGGQGVNPALAQVVKDEESAMQRMGQTVDASTLARARSASGKVAMQRNADRPKSYSVLNLTHPVEKHTEMIYRLVQKWIGEEETVLNLGDGQGAMLMNERVREPVLATTHSGEPLTMESLRTRSNPAGLVFSTRTFRRGDLRIPMEATADSRADWPSDMLAGLQLAGAMAEAGILKSEKMRREKVLDERTRRLDDQYFEEEQKQKMAQALQMASQQAQAQEGGDQSIQGTQNPILAPAAQDGMQQTTPGGNAGPTEMQVGSQRGSAAEEGARQSM
jgi:hypothetical protein